MRLKDKVAVITGGGSGLGRECALLFAENGARIVILDRQESRATDAAKLVISQGGEAIGIAGDVAIEANAKLAVDTALEAYGKLDIMFANAGTQQSNFMDHPSFEDTTNEVWQDVLATNLTGVIWTLKHAIQAMKASGGAIVVTGSAAALRAFPETALYSATKGGVNSLAICLSREVGKYGIRINVLNPTGGMSANFLLPRDAPVLGKSYEEAAGDKWDGQAAAAPLKLPMPPRLRDNANAVLFMVSDESRYMSGQSITPADGGVINSVAMSFKSSWIEDMTGDAQ